MVTTNGGINDIGASGGGTVSGPRRDSQPQSSSGSFGDTLKSQMGGAGDSRASAAHRASDSHASTAAGDSQGHENKEKNPNAKQATASGDSAKAGSGRGPKKVGGKKNGRGNDGSTDAGQHTAAVAVPPAAANAAATSAADGTATSPQEENGTSGMGGGKNLPLAAALPGTDPAASGGADLPTAPNLPNLLQSLGDKGAASTNAATAERNNSPDAVAGSGDGSAGDSSLLKELQALAAGVAGKDGKSNGGTTGQDTNADALLKLIGDAAKGASALSQPSGANPGPVSASSAMSPSPSSAPASAAAPAQLAVAVPVNQPGWDQAVAERVVWLAQQGVQQASIHLHPKNMGPIDVHIALHKDDASVAFVAHHAMTRDAIQSAMPKLREMMQQSGLNLAQSDVSHQSFGQHQQTNGQGQPGGRQGATSGSAIDGVGAAPISGEILLHGGVALGAVDYYA